MNLTDVLKNKKLKSDKLKQKYSLNKKNKPFGLIKLKNKNLLKDIRDGLLELPMSFVIEVDWVDTEKLWENIVATSKVLTSDLIAFDFILCDDEVKWLNKYFEKWITPIIIKDNTLSSILKDFNPIKNEGNAFLYDRENKWSIYSALVRYNENYKFPFDNKNLVKNVLKV